MRKTGAGHQPHGNDDLGWTIKNVRIGVSVLAPLELTFDKLRATGAEGGCQMSTAAQNRRSSFFTIWVKGPADKLATGFKAALDELGKG